MIGVGLFLSDKEKDYYEGKEKFEAEQALRYISTQRIIVESSQSFVTECRKVNCICNESPVLESCDSMIGNMTSGMCNDGYHCCQMMSDICAPSECWTNNCNCRGTRQVFTHDINGNPIYNTVTVCDDTNYGCYVCNRYMYECNPRCARSVTNQLCEVQCDNQYTVDYKAIHVPSRFEVMDVEQFAMYRECAVIVNIDSRNDCYHDLFNNQNYTFKVEGRVECPVFGTDCTTSHALAVGGTTTMFLDIETAPNLPRGEPIPRPEYKKADNFKLEWLAYGVVGGLALFISFFWLLTMMASGNSRHRCYVGRVGTGGHDVICCSIN